jgi:hypothetical protein
MINSKQSCGGTTDIERTEVAQVPQTRDATIEPAELSLSSERPCRSQRRDREARDRHRERDARERDALHGAWSRKSGKSDQKMTKTRSHAHRTLALQHSGRARARTQAHTTHRETTHTDRTDHSRRARATTKLRGVARRASYAVGAAQAVRVAPWRSRSSRWPREGRRRWRRQQSAPVMAPEH